MSELNPYHDPLVPWQLVSANHQTISGADLPEYLPIDIFNNAYAALNLLSKSDQNHPFVAYARQCLDTVSSLPLDERVTFAQQTLLVARRNGWFSFNSLTHAAHEAVFAVMLTCRWNERLAYLHGLSALRDIGFYKGHTEV